MRKKYLLLLILPVLLSCNYSSSNDDSSSTSSSTSTSSTSSSTSSDSIDLEGYLPYEEAFESNVVDTSDSYKDGEFSSPYIKNIDSNDLNKIQFTSLNDVHGALYFSNIEEGNGFDRTQYYFNQVSPSINILNGDIFQGMALSNETRGKAFVDTINQMDFSCFVIGNHEFDWGMDNLKRFKDGNESNGELSIPFLGANIYYEGTDLHPSFIDPYMIVNQGSTKIGIIGMIGDNLESSISSNMIEGYEFKNSLSLTKTYSKLLREEHQCDYVILSIHDYDEEFFNSIASLEDEYRIDLVFGGHTHYVKDDAFSRNDGSSLLALQGGANNEYIVNASISLENDEVTYSIDRYDSNYDSAIRNYIYSNYSETINMAEGVINSFDIYRSKTQIGRETVEYLKNRYNASGAIINTAGVRDGLSRGDVTYNDVLSVYPFDNLVYDVIIDGRSVLSYIRSNEDYIYYSIDDEVISSSKLYHIVLIDYVYTNSYNQRYFDGSYFKYLDINIREAYIEYLSNL